jgi:DNA methyltransferase 1-associated protein 1
MAGASAADVRSILSLPSSSTPAPAQPKKASAPLTRKPSGISRELYSLIGPAAPTLVAQVAKPRLKQKPNFGGGGSSKWCVPLASAENAVLRNGAGCGSLSRTLRGRMGCSLAIGSKPTRTRMLVRPSLSPSLLGIDTAPEYPFARYNAKSPDYRYSEEEYTQFLEGPRLDHHSIAHTHIIIRSRMGQGRDRLPFQSHPRIRFAVLHCQRPL